MSDDQNVDDKEQLRFRAPLPHEILDDFTVLLIANLRGCLAIQGELVLRIIRDTHRPSRYLAEFLEDTANRYSDFSEQILAASQIEQCRVPSPIGLIVD